MSRPHAIVIGAGSKLAADGTGRLLQFGLAYYAQIRLGPADYGYLVYAMALGLVGAQIADGGLQLSVTREMARDAARARDVARAGLRMKVTLALAAAALLAVVAAMRPPSTRLATWAAGTAVIAASFVDYVGFAFRGLQRVVDDARLTLASRVLTVSIGACALWQGAGLAGFTLAQLGAACLVGLVACLWLQMQLPERPTEHPSLTGLALLAKAWPLGIAIFLSILYLRTPIFLLDAWSGAAAVGVFGVAQRLIEPLGLVPAAVLAAAFPAMVHHERRDAGRARDIRLRTTAGLAAVGVALSAAAVVLGPDIVRWLYGGQYPGVERPLQILAMALGVTFANYALTHTIIAFDRQRHLMVINAAVLVVNVVLCAALVPAYGPPGAASALLLSEVVLLTLCVTVLRQPRDIEPVTAAPTPVGPVL